MTFATHAFGAVAMALAGIIAAELATGAGAEQAVPDAAPQPSLPAPSPPQERPEHREQSAAWALSALARPLFSADRRPPGPADAAPVPSPSTPPRLTGTLVSRDGKRAILATGDKPVVAEEGSRIDAWTVQEISAGSVTLAGPDGPLVLRMSFVQNHPAQAVQVVQLTTRPVRTHSRTGTAGNG